MRVGFVAGEEGGGHFGDEVAGGGCVQRLVLMGLVEVCDLRTFVEEIGEGSREHEDVVEECWYVFAGIEPLLRPEKMITGTILHGHLVRHRSDRWSLSWHVDTQGQRDLAGSIFLVVVARRP